MEGIVRGLEDTAQVVGVETSEIPLDHEPTSGLGRIAIIEPDERAMNAENGIGSKLAALSDEKLRDLVRGLEEEKETNPTDIGHKELDQAMSEKVRRETMS